MSRVRPTINCACCGRTGSHQAHGWIAACYWRWMRAGQPEEGPPAPFPPGPDNWAHARAGYARIAAERLERYGELRRGGFTIQQAAWDMRIHSRTADRYEARLRTQKDAP